MPRPARRRAGLAVIRCPVCGNQSHFAVYIAILRVHHVTQQAPGRWRHTSTEPLRLDLNLPFLLVCESCGFPQMTPPQSVLSVIPNRSRRRK